MKCGPKTYFSRASLRSKRMIIFFIVMYHSLSCECEQHDKLHKSRSHCSDVLYWITVAVCKHSFSITQSVCALSLFEVSDVNHKI